MLTEGAAWVPDASCLLTRALPLSFTLSPWAITDYTTEDARGVSDRGGAVNSTWLLQLCGGCRALWLLRPAQVCEAVSRHTQGIKHPRSGPCLLVALDSLQRNHGNSLPKSATFCPVCHKHVMHDMKCKTCHDWGGIPSGIFSRTCSRMPHPKTMTAWLQGCQSKRAALSTKLQTELTTRLQCALHR